MERTTVRCSLNQFVWAKITGFCYWPGLILKPDSHAPPRSETNMKWVYFFGSHNYAWVLTKFIKPYEEYESKFKEKCPAAVVKASHELRKHKKRLTKNPDYELDIVKFMPKRARTRSESAASRRSNRSKRSKSSRSAVEDEENEVSSDSEIYVTEARVGVFAGNLYCEAIVKALIACKHKVVIWSESEAFCADMKRRAADVGTSCFAYEDPRDVVRSADIIFSLLASKAEAINMLQRLGYKSKNDWLLNGKTYIEMTTMNYQASQDHEKILKAKGAVYLEVMIEGTKEEVAKRDTTVLIGGELETAKAIIAKYKSCFWVLGKTSYFVGSSTKIHAIFQMMKAIFLACFTEILALADKCVDFNVFLELFKESPLCNSYLKHVCDKIQNNTYFEVQESLPGLQQDLQQMLEICDLWKQPVPMSATANQFYKHARLMGFDDRDSSAMYLRAK